MMRTAKRLRGSRSVATAVLHATLGLLSATPLRAAPPGPPYAGSTACRACHRSEVAAWEGSPHARQGTAVARPPLPFDVAVGSRWMQSYFARDETGAHRVVARCYDIREGVWRDVATVLDGIRGRRPGVDPPSLGPLGLRSFEVDCAGCHSSRPVLRVELTTGRLEGRWHDLALDCETCHGGGADHAGSWKGLREPVAMERLERLPARARTALCARCHGGPAAAGDFGPEDARHFVGLLGDREGHFPDGSASGQVYQYSAFVRSPCHVEGNLSCTDCHEAHGAGMRAAAHKDALCTRCHEGYVTAAHTHHDVQQEGGRCVSCHMPRLLTGFMAHQRDHRIGLPLPATPHAPDACTACHLDRDKQWADAAYRRWWGDPPRATLDAIEGVVLARASDPRATPLLRRALRHPDPFFRASATLYLQDPDALHDDPLAEVRLAALRAGALRADAPAHLARGLLDAEPVVRGSAALRLRERGGAPDPAWAGDLEVLVRHRRELAEARILLGRLRLDTGEAARALPHFEEAVVFRPLASDGWLGLAAALRQSGRDDEARAAELRLALLLRARLASRPADGRLAEEAAQAFERAGEAARAAEVLDFAMGRAATSADRSRLLQARARLAAGAPEGGP